MSGGHTKAQSQKHHGLNWIDLENPGSELLAQLEHEYQLHPIHVKESLQKVQHSRVEREQHYLFYVVHVPVITRSNKLTVYQMGIFLGKDYLITIRNGANPSLQQLFEVCDDDSNIANKCFQQGSGYLLHVLMNDLLDNISNMTDAITTELDELEDLVFNNSTSNAERIGKVRQAIVRLRRVIGPKRFVLQDLTEQVRSFDGEAIAKYYSNNTKKASRLWEVIEEAKETVEIYKDADFTTSTERTNKILAVLTIIFTLSIPTTLVAAIYGMNVPLPGGLTTGPWDLFGRYTTLSITIVGSLVFAAAMYAYFHRKKWF